jgi:hypothetical protein
MDIFAKITGIRYMPRLCRELHTFAIDELERALSTTATFKTNEGIGVMASNEAGHESNYNIIRKN